MTDLMKGVWWYDHMTEDIKTLWLYNISDDQIEYIWDMYFENYVAFLSESFVWNDTPEGFEFWLNVSNYEFYETK
jgi:hypothetical protein